MNVRYTLNFVNFGFIAVYAIAFVFTARWAIRELLEERLRAVFVLFGWNAAVPFLIVALEKFR